MVENKITYTVKIIARDTRVPNAYYILDDVKLGALFSSCYGS